ncbi:hypothetical protein ACRQ1B_09205 [Rhizobium panacihumi]|uniref:hypothetical protein n=1 Tax=Rhizobium panacihumi TaxID=2008450 RepID=UPI003D792ABC
MAGGEQTRSKKLKRLVNLQRHMEKMAENELAATGRQIVEVNQSKERVIEAIGSMSPVHMQFSQDYASRFGRLMVREKQLTGIQQAQEVRVLKERTKGDRLEDQMKEARVHEDREKDDNAIYDLLEITLATGGSKSY